MSEKIILGNIGEPNKPTSPIGETMNCSTCNEEGRWGRNFASCGIWHPKTSPIRETVLTIAGSYWIQCDERYRDIGKELREQDAHTRREVAKVLSKMGIPKLLEGHIWLTVDKDSFDALIKRLEE